MLLLLLLVLDGNAPARAGQGKDRVQPFDFNLAVKYVGLRLGLCKFGHHRLKITPRRCSAGRVVLCAWLAQHQRPHRALQVPGVSGLTSHGNWGPKLLL